MKIGIYGGTFSPPHNGHTSAAVSFLNKCNLDKLYVIPTSTPPHKHIANKDNPNMRLEMTKLAFSGLDSRIYISDIEIKRSGLSYSVDTVKYFHDNISENLYMLVGTDMFLTLDKWFRAEDIFKNVCIVCARRENELENKEKISRKLEEYKEKFNANVIILDAPPVPMDSSSIRHAISSGFDVSDMISPSVFDFIRKNGLYGCNINTEKNIK